MQKGKTHYLWNHIFKDEQFKIFLLAIIVGILVAYAAISFRLLFELIQELLFNYPLSLSLQNLSNIPWWILLIVPSLGGLFVGILIQTLLQNHKPLGVADVIAAGALNRGRMSLSLTIKGAIINSISIGVGASVGREGPIIHLGAGFASWIAKKTGLSPALSLTILGCGVASAIGASFNAPIAGVFFALEVVIGHYALHTFTPIVISSVAGTIVSRIHFGDYPAFILPEYSIASFFEFPAFILLGILSSIVALFFMKSIFLCEDAIDKLNIPIWLRPFFAGIFIGIIALFLPQTLGIGYAATNAALYSSLSLGLLITLVIAKTMTTAACLGCGFGGGVFSPSIFVGAMLGGAFGMFASSFFPDLASNPGFYALIGMAAVAAPIIGAPISTILIAFELTGEFSAVTAAMVSVSISCLICHRISGGSYFTQQLNRQGKKVYGSRLQQILSTQKVRDIMSYDFEIIKTKTLLSEIRSIISNSTSSDFIVVDESENLIGFVDLNSSRSTILNQNLDKIINAKDLSESFNNQVRPDDEISFALEIMEKQGLEYLPVILNNKILGIVHQKEALITYNKTLVAAQAAEHNE